MGYYVGDPGFFSVFRSIAGAAAGMIPGVGGGLSRVIGGLGKRGASSVMAKATGAIIKHPVLSAAGAAGALAVGGMSLEHAAPGAFGLMRRGGRKPSARHLRALAMGLKRAKPRMNVTNVHALRRSLRRAYGFARLAMKTIHLVHPRKKARFGGFRHRRRKAA